MITIDSKALSRLADDLDRYPQISSQAAKLAVNEAARFGRVRAVEAMLAQVNLKKSYLNGKVYVAETAKTGTDEAVILAEFEPISLANFSSTPRGKRRFGGGQRGVTVRVKKDGGAQKLRRGFFIRLRRGNTGELGNEGLAVRVKSGQRPTGTGAARKLFEDSYGDTWLLYGPSANQVFFFVREDISPVVAERLASEYLRQFERLQNG